MYTHRGAYLNALSEALHARLDPRSVYLWTLPMFHCNGWCFTWAVTAVGATHVCLRKVDPPLVWRLLEEKQGVTHFNGAPAVLVMLASDPAARRLERLILVTTAGAPPPPAVHPPHRGSRLPDQPRLRADRDVWADHDFERITRSSPLTVGIGKEAFYAQIELDEHRAYDLTKSVMSMNSLAGDAQEGLCAFLEKREPTWKGS